MADAGKDGIAFAVESVGGIKNLDDCFRARSRKRDESFKEGVEPPVQLCPERQGRLPRNQDGIVPLVALKVVVGQILPLRLNIHDFEAGIPCDRRKAEIGRASCRERVCNDV